MNNAKDEQQTKSTGTSLSEQIITVLFDNMHEQVEFDDVCIAALKTLAKSGNLSNEQHVLAALRKVSKH